MKVNNLKRVNAARFTKKQLSVKLEKAFYYTIKSNQHGNSVSIFFEMTNLIGVLILRQSFLLFWLFSASLNRDFLGFFRFG